MIYIGSDHGGFSLKNDIVAQLRLIGVNFEDVSEAYVEGDDYPDVCEIVCKKVSQNPVNRGILLCGSGTGMVICANKHNGIRAAFGYSTYAARIGRSDNDINVITFAGRKQTIEEVWPIVCEYLDSPFSNAERHVRRINKLFKIENDV